MFHKLTKAQFPFEGEPPALAKVPPRIPVGSIVEDDPVGDVGETLSADGTLRRVKFRMVSDVRHCWLPVEFLEPAEAAERPPIIPWAFLTTCVQAEEWINALPDTGTNYVNADYLIALALYESGLANVGNITPGTDAVGPFQITSTRWSQYLDKAHVPELTADDRDNVSDQIFGTAFLTREDTRAISEAITAHDQGAGTNTEPEKTGPYIPTYSDVFIAAVVTPLAAIELRKLQIAGKVDARIDEIVKNLDDLREAEMERIFRHNHHVFKVDKAEAEAKGVAAGPRTVADFYAAVNAKIDQLLADAFKLMQLHVPELLPITAGDAPWLEIALREQVDPWQNGVLKENSAAGTKRVLEYFDATNLSTSKVLAWCGAFAAFCMKEVGGKVADTIVHDPAWAASWKKWGNLAIPLGSADIPVGAVVVMSPPPDGSRSGHVSFYSPTQSGVAGKVTLLGGNQSNSVKDSDFDRSEVAAIRWVGPPLGSGGDVPGSDVVPPGEGIAWGRYVDKKFGNDAFKKKVIAICEGMDCDPSYLMAAMSFETARSFSAKQKNLAGGSATGLIQFTPIAAADLGTTVAELATMTELRQLDFVEKYMTRWAKGRPFKKLSDVYMAILAPAFFGNSDSTVIYENPSKNYKANAGLDANKDGRITVGESTAKVLVHLHEGLKLENRG
ncbi:hypothetical protein [Rhizobium sp. C4]|uniref:hypothetical protein n=1 Tax=Rhizobium sp. C4 TaxID=1349800 RepID=UPI001E5A2757|nr:hypothetical protein [Rhizobium sp. C4]MCD2175045.1 hypothetical protein [Rhizobium sp. C4]